MNGRTRSQNKFVKSDKRKISAVKIGVQIKLREHQAYTDPWKHQRWDQVPRRLSIGCTRREPSSIIVNAEFFRYQSQCVKCGLTIGMKTVRQHMAQGKFVIMNWIIVTAIELAKRRHQTRLQKSLHYQLVCQ
jgi:hypothetical protein